MRTDYDAYERRCQIICASQPHVSLKDLLEGAEPSPRPASRNRLHFRDYLIMPIQRVCRYPLLLAQLLGAASTPSPTSEHPPFGLSDDEYDVGVDVERALGAMRGVAEEADDARRSNEAEVKSATIVDRMEPHPAITSAFLRSLGTCRLIGSLDVLHQHPTIAPLIPPVKVKYMAAFLYKGYLILAKVKRGKAYEAKHFLPLEVFELIDITEGELPIGPADGQASYLILSGCNSAITALTSPRRAKRRRMSGPQRWWTRAMQGQSRLSSYRLASRHSRRDPGACPMRRRQTLHPSG